MQLAVFATALATLAVEVFYTRLFSALFWRNAASAILSLAMLGIGASGVLVYVAPALFPARRAERQVAGLLLAFAVSVVGSYVWILHLAAESYDAMQPLSRYVELVLAALPPFVTGGLVLTVVFTHAADRIGQLYRLDLVGAALGTVVALPALWALNGPALVPVLAAIPAIAGAIFAFRHGERKMAAAGVALTAGLAVLFALHLRSGVLRVTHSHGYEERGNQAERWDPLARVTVQDFGPLSKWLNIDSQVPTAILKWDGRRESVSYLKHNVLQVAYRMRSYPKIVIIGPGGGSDVLAALTSGNRDITGVEVNRSTIDLMKNELATYTGGLYLLPEVKIRIADGRAYVASMHEQVDLIQATLVDTFTAGAAGSHTLTENYLYTVDGFRDFLDHLKPEGVLSLSRWGGENFGFAETYRATGLALSALESYGLPRPSTRIVVVQGAPPDRLTLGGGYQMPGAQAESMSTLLVKREPFTAAELDRLTAAIQESHFRALWLGERGGNDVVLRQLMTATDRSEIHRRYRRATGLDIAPVTDDRPFFFDMLNPGRALFERPKPEWEKDIYYWSRALDVGMLHALLRAVALAAAALLVLPLLLRLRDLRGVQRPVSTLGYFVCLGVGFIGIELSLMQRFSLFLEHPVTALVVFMSAILFFSGLGSASTTRIVDNHAKAAARRAGLLVVLLLVYGVGIQPLTRALIGLPLIVKGLVAVTLSVPPAFLMGTLFPLGIAAIRRRAERLVPWAWGLSAAFSVVGAVGSLLLAMSLGYRTTWHVFVAAYALAAFSMTRIAKVV